MDMVSQPEEEAGGIDAEQNQRTKSQDQGDQDGLKAHAQKDRPLRQLRIGGFLQQGKMGDGALKARQTLPDQGYLRGVHLDSRRSKLKRKLTC
jgi:hypothetical protein